MSITTLGPAWTKRTARRLRHGPGLVQRAKWSSQALFLAAFWRVAGLMSLDRAAAMGGALMRWLSPCLGRTRRIRLNLSMVCPDRSKPQIERLVRDIWGSFGQLLAEYAHLETLCADQRDARIEIALNWDIEAYRRAGKPAVFVTAHMANWELAAASTVAIGFRLAVVYTPLKNPIVDRMLQRKRRVVGCDFVAKAVAGRQLLRALRDGQSVGLLVDQRVGDGAPVPFFGQAALTSITPARLALKFGCDLVPVQVERLGGSRFRVTYHRPVRPDSEAADGQQQALEMSRRINEHFESWIRRRPEQWICWKRRWPKASGAGAPLRTAP